MTVADPIVRLRMRGAQVGADRPIRLVDLLETPGIQAVVLASSKDPNAKVTVLLFPPGSTSPSLAVKVPTTDGAEHTLETERGRLEALHQLGVQAVLTTIPIVVNVVDCDGRSALVLSGLPGSPMTTHYHRWRHTAQPEWVMADFRTAGTWLAEFHRETASVVAPIDMDGRCGELLADRFEAEPDMPKLLAVLQGIHARLHRYQTPRTWVHGDFWCGNILMADGRISGVVDWEAASPEGEPLRDLVRFAITYALYLDRHTRAGRPVAGHRGLRAERWGAGVAYAINGAGWFPAVFQQFLRDGLQRLGAPGDCWRDAALAGIAEVAALADHTKFARQHLCLFKHLAMPKEQAAQ